MRGLMGSFSVLPLGDLLELLERRKVSGSLTCERGTIRKTVLLSSGVVTGAASNDAREYLGQLLVNFGHLTDEGLQKAFRVQAETRVRLGKVLTMGGVVTPEVVRDTLAIKIRETLLDVFLWDSGTFHFDDTPPEAVDELDPVVALAEVVRESEFRTTAWSAFRGEFPSGTATLEVVEENVPPGLDTSTLDGRLLALARHGATIDELGLTLRAADFHLYQRLYALARQGVVRAAAPRSRVTPPPVASPARAEESVEVLMGQARGLLEDGRADDAETVAARAVELAPRSPEARALLLDAERMLTDQLREELLDPPRVPVLQVKQSELGGLKLSSADKYLLSRCDGARTVAQIAQRSPLRELDVLRALRRLADAGVIELASPGPAPSGAGP
jgi:hypothetical protein